MENSTSSYIRCEEEARVFGQKDCIFIVDIYNDNFKRQHRNNDQTISKKWMFLCHAPIRQLIMNCMPFDEDFMDGSLTRKDTSNQTV